MQQHLENSAQTSVYPKAFIRHSEGLRSNRLSLILDQLDDSIALFNSRHQLVECNKSLIDLWSLPSTWLGSRPHWHEILNYLTAQGQLTDRQSNNIQHHLEHAGTQVCSFKLLLADGCSLEMQVTATAEDTVLLVIKRKTAPYPESPSGIHRVTPTVHPKGFPQRLPSSLHERVDLWQQGEQPLRAIFTHATLGIGVISLDRRIIDCNLALQRLLGYANEELYGVLLAAFTHPEDVSRDEVYYQELLAGERSFYQIETRLLSKEEQVVWVRLTMGLMRDRQNNPEYVFTLVEKISSISTLGTLTDIAQQHSQEEALQQAERQAALRHLQQEIKKHQQVEEELRMALDRAQKLNQIKSRFLAMVYHELGNPLTTIYSATQLLEYKDISETKRASYFQMIQAAVAQMRQLMEDVLLIGKAEAETIQVKPTVMDLNQFCCHLLSELQLSSKNHYQLQLVSRCSDPKVYLDAKLLRQILGNLLTNAIKYSPQGGTIQLKVMRQDDEVIFQVQDEGIGIPSQELPHVFESFKRANNVGEIPGTGLGLAIVKHCVDALAGKISITSQEDEGTTFQVVLPLASSSTPSPTTLSPAER